MVLRTILGMASSVEGFHGRQKCYKVDLLNNVKIHEQNPEGIVITILNRTFVKRLEST